MITINYGSSTSSWKPLRWVRLDLVFTIREIYINPNLNPLKKFASSRSMNLKISSYERSPKWSRRLLISTRIVISYAMKRSSLFEFDGKSMEIETKTSESPNWSKFISKQILVSEERNKCKKAGLWESQ